MSYTRYRGADIGECLATASKIKEGDFESWFDAWHMTATRLEKQADESFNNRQYHSARDTYLRASNYHRTSGFYLNENPEDPRFKSAWKKSVDLFVKAMSLFPYEFEQVEIAFEEGILPCYFFKPCNSGVYFGLFDQGFRILFDH